MKQPVRLLSVFKDHQFRSINGSLRSCPDVLFVFCLCFVCVGGHCPKCSDYHGDHWGLHPPHLFSSPLSALVFFQLLVFLFPDVTITWCSYIYHYGLLPLLVHDCHGRFVSYHEFFRVYFEIPQDLWLVILNNACPILTSGFPGPEVKKGHASCILCQQILTTLCFFFSLVLFLEPPFFPLKRVIALFPPPSFCITRELTNGCMLILQMWQRY